MREQYAEFDAELRKDKFLNRHYECLPFIGEKYKDSRLLLIGESHYVPKEKCEVQCVDRKDFYDVAFDELEEGEYKNWINTRFVFERRVYGKEELKGFFINPAAEIAKVLNHTDIVSIDQKIEAMHQYAFMNYFKRPAYEKGKTIKELTDTDNQYAYEISKHIIDVLKPKLIVFISKKAYRAFCELDQGDKPGANHAVQVVSHPSCSWWNRKRTDGGCGREDFHNYIKDFYSKQTVSSTNHSIRKG